MKRDIVIAVVALTTDVADDWVVRGRLERCV